MLVASTPIDLVCLGKAVGRILLPGAKVRISFVTIAGSCVLVRITNVSVIKSVVLETSPSSVKVPELVTNDESGSRVETVIDGAKLEIDELTSGTVVITSMGVGSGTADCITVPSTNTVVNSRVEDVPTSGSIVLLMKGVGKVLS